MSKIKNRRQLLSDVHSPRNRKARRIVLNAVEKALEAADPKKTVKSKVARTGSLLAVDGILLDLARIKKIYVIGGGKASGPMAEALEEILGERVEDGLVVVPKGTANKYKAERIRFHEASHPIPDESSIEGARRLLALAGRAEKKDLVICLISGGGSSLIALPREGVTLGDKQIMTDLLLKSGATINEINTVRKHISGFKGGRLAEVVYPGAILSLLLSDVIGDPLEVIASGPTVPDSTSFADALCILERYGLWERTPEPIRRVLSDGSQGLIPETPKSNNRVFKRVHNVVIGNNRMACSAATAELQRAGLNTLFLTSFLEGEARSVGVALAALARETLTSANPVRPPAGIVAGGETTVTVIGKGIGGRNQEIALAAALKADGLDRVVLASFSTDGVDGPTVAAGAIIDGQTITRSRKLGLDARQFLKNNDSYSFFAELGDLIETGPTGTNVNDVTIITVI